MKYFLNNLHDLNDAISRNLVKYIPDKRRPLFNKT